MPALTAVMPTALKPINFDGLPMKKIFLSLLVLIPGTSVIADIKFDDVNKRFYSTPLSPDIDQVKYHDICSKCLEILRAWAGAHGIYIEDLFNTSASQIEEINTLIKNPAALNDLVKRFNLFGKILDAEAKINPHHAKTIARFYLDISFLCTLLPTPK